MSNYRLPKAIRDYMTPAPHTIGRDKTLAEAHAIMRENRIRHLPVLDDGRLVGIVSQRDLALIESLPDVDAASVCVEDAMTKDLYVVGPRESVAKVAHHMAERKLGSAIIADGDRILGVFTVTDACCALAALVEGGPRRRRRRASSSAALSRGLM